MRQVIRRSRGTAQSSIFRNVKLIDLDIDKIDGASYSSKSADRTMYLVFYILEYSGFARPSPTHIVLVAFAYLCSFCTEDISFDHHIKTSLQSPYIYIYVHVAFGSILMNRFSHVSSWLVVLPSLSCVISYIITYSIFGHISDIGFC